MSLTIKINQLRENLLDILNIYTNNIYHNILV